MLEILVIQLMEKGIGTENEIDVNELFIAFLLDHTFDPVTDMFFMGEIEGKVFIKK